MWKWIVGIVSASALAFVAYLAGWLDFIIPGRDKPEDKPVEITDLTKEDRTQFHQVCSVQEGVSLDAQALSQFIEENQLEKIAKTGMIQSDDQSSFVRSKLGQLVANPIPLRQACNDQQDISRLRSELNALFEAADELKSAARNYPGANDLISLAEELSVRRSEYESLWTISSDETYISPLYTNEEAEFLTERLGGIYELIAEHLSDEEFFAPRTFTELADLVSAKSILWQNKSMSAVGDTPVPVNLEPSLLAFVRTLYPIIGTEELPVDVPRTISSIGR